MPLRPVEHHYLQKPLLFCQTAARAPALESATGHIFAESGARMAEMRRTCTETLVVSHRKGLPVRLFGENAFAAHGIVQVSQYASLFFFS